jgi:predicted HicB family RNase H-like nuclease
MEVMTLENNDYRITLRMPEGLKDKLAAEAEDQGRSLNNLMVKILQDHVKDQERRAGE